ncbi:MAG: LiaF transmembrane domain-containing protein [Anaerolineales bacterium]
MSNNDTHPRRRRVGLFFPLLLIIVGVFLLLSNFGVISGDFWTLIWQFWPLLLIVIGLDSIFKREGLVASAFMIGVGVIFLLANLGYLNVSVWQMILTLWPILIIAIGFDILIGRRSLLASIAGILVIIAILLGSLWLFGATISGGAALTGEQFEQALNGATRASVSFEVGAGDVQLGTENQPDTLLTGSVPSGSYDRVQISYTVSGGNGSFVLRDTGTQGFMPFGSLQSTRWQLLLSESVPIELQMSLGAGNLDADLRSSELESLMVNTAVGNTQVVLPQAGRLDAQVTGAIGQIVIVVPRGVGVRVNPDTALVSVNVPDGYLSPGDVYESPNYDSADNRIDLSVDLAIGNVVIRQE